MPSPFPGMNPYLEQDDVWQDFHQSFMPFVREALNPQVQPNYLVKLEEHLFIHQPGEEERALLGRADLAVSQFGLALENPPAVSLAAPLTVQLPIPVDIERQAFLEIRDRRSRELITVIELLSPANKKPGSDREQYRAKRGQLLASSVHLVEIDLLRGGPRLSIPGLPNCDYYILVSRAEERPTGGVWPLGLRDPLPTVPIPLREGDPDASLDLQAVLHRVYDSAGYEHYIYTSEPQPRLALADAVWAEQLLPPETRASRPPS